MGLRLYDVICEGPHYREVVTPCKHDTVNKRPKLRKTGKIAQWVLVYAICPYFCRNVSPPSQGLNIYQYSMSVMDFYRKML